MRAATGALRCAAAGPKRGRVGTDTADAREHRRTDRPARSTSAEPGAGPGSRLGDQLRAERERRGLRVGHVSEATKIRKCYLEALERQEWDALPADVFARGYLRSYGEYLGLDVERLLRAYAREREVSGADEPSRDGLGDRDLARLILERLAATRVGPARPRLGCRIGWTAAVLLVVAAVGAFGVWTALHLPGPGRGAPVATVAPSLEEPGRTPPAAWPEPTGSQCAPRASAPPLDRAAGEPPSRAAPEDPPPRERRDSEARATGTPTPEPALPGVLGVSQFGIWTDAETDPLAGSEHRFEEGTVVWFWTRVLGGRPGDRIRHVWLHEGRKIAVERLDIGGPSWRAQSRRWLEPGSAGRWVVEARDARGRVLARSEFACVPAGAARAAAEPGPGVLHGSP